MVKRYSFVMILLLSHCIVTAHLVESLYGTCDITEPVLCELLQSQAVTRLQRIHQYGVDHWIHPTRKPYTRYTHSLGVLLLLRKFGASVTEQVAGLLHDVSHTVFSHVGDHVAAQMKRQRLNQNNEAYQDSMHTSYLAQTDVAPILARHGIALEDINHKKGTFFMLERELPDICADRLEYNLYGAYIEGWINEEQIDAIIKALHYEHGTWFFDDREQARLFADISISLCEEIFSAVWNIAAYEWAAKALLRAVTLNLLSMADIHFGYDDDVWRLLIQCEDFEIQQAVCGILAAKYLYTPATSQDFDLSYVSKFRGIDPWVRTDTGLQRLATIDASFAERFAVAKKAISTTRYYKCIA